MGIHVEANASTWEAEAGRSQARLEIRKILFQKKGVKDTGRAGRERQRDWGKRIRNFYIPLPALSSSTTTTHSLPTVPAVSEIYRQLTESENRVDLLLICYKGHRKNSQMEAALRKLWGRRGSRTSVLPTQSPVHPNPPDTLTFNQHALLALPFRSFYGNFIT